MTDSQERSDLLRDIAQSIDPNLCNADWGRVLGQAVYETEDEDLILFVLAEGGAKIRSHSLSQLRKKSRDAAYRIASSTNGHKIEATAQQLEMPIVVPGLPPMALARSTHRFLVDACEAAERHIKGALQNLSLWKRARDVSEPWPDEQIGTLIQRGDITPEQLVQREQKAA